MTGRARARETAASAAQYLLLGGFAAVAAGISAQGLTGFARDNMGLDGPWPYLLFLALDGAAGVCAVLLTRRAARAESGLAPRLAVWGLVAASASFNWTHAPHHPGAPEAFAVMPVIGAVLFEFTLRELRLRSGGRDRQLTALRWLHPAERIRVQLRLAADELISAETATRRVRIDQAAKRLYQLRLALHDRNRSRHEAATAQRLRGAERRAQAALTRAGFADPDVAAAVLRQVQVLTQTADLARLDYSTAAAAYATIAALISGGPHATPPPAPQAPPPIPQQAGSLPDSRAPGRPVNDHPPGGQPPAQASIAQATGTPASAELQSVPRAADGHDANLEGHLIAAAADILTQARLHGHRLSQKALGDKLRRDGHRVANYRLHALKAAASALTTDIHADNGKVNTEPSAPAATLRSASESHPAPGSAGPARQSAKDAAESAESV